MQPDYSSADYQHYLKDQIEDNLAPGYDRQYLDRLIGRFPKILDYANAKILDVGCRAFESYDYFLAKFHNEILGIDIGKEGLDYCKEHNKPCLNIDAHRMCEYFADESFDLVLAFHSFEHMYDLPHVLRSCRAILKPTGYLFYAIPMPSHNWRRGHWYDVPTPQAMIEMCKRAALDTEYHEVLRNLEIRPQTEMIGVAKPSGG